MITKGQAVDFMVLWFDVGVVVLLLVAFGGLLVAVWAIRKRQRAWDEYIAAWEERETKSVNLPRTRDHHPDDDYEMGGAPRPHLED